MRPGPKKPPLAVCPARDYTVTMSSAFAPRFKLCTLLCSLALAGLLAACGPKDVGEGTSVASETPPLGVNAEDQMRYPITGSNRTQQLLYLQNRPDVMQNVQQWRMMKFRRANGLDNAADPEDPQYRAVPKQRSPFRQ